MAGSVFHGKQGRVTFDTGATANVIRWEINATAEVVGTTVMSPVDAAATTHWKDYVAGFLDWTATVECLADDGGLDPNEDADFAQDDDGKALVLFSGLNDSGPGSSACRKYSGNAIITNIAPSVDKNGVVTIIYSYQGSGTLTAAASDYNP